MSASINLFKESRPFKIDVFGLQDNFINVLQAYEDSFIGQVIEPKIDIKQDGSQSFSCKIPKYYLSEIPNERVLNPRWEDFDNGVLAENTRILKVFIKYSDGQTKIYPFIIDKIINKRDNNFSVYKEISASGLAFSELGKIGYKTELNNSVLDKDFQNNPDTLATIDYWLDKIFPNEKDEEGNITRWLTPWSYEIRMDWRGYLEEYSDITIDAGDSFNKLDSTIYDGQEAKYIGEDKNWLSINAGVSGPLYQERDSSRIYEKPFIKDWKISNNKLRPISVESFQEKARIVDIKNSNKYNITQTLAETFEVFCTYEYACDSNGYFKKTYYDDLGNLWTGKKVVFFNRAINTENPFVINYQHNLQSISRTIDSSEVYTKMYVNPVASDVLDTGYVSIADTTLNPLLEDYILNFDYLYEIGSISDYQKSEITSFETKIHKINKQLVELEEEYNKLTILLNEKESLKAQSEASLASAQEQLVDYEALRDSEITNTPVLRNASNSYFVTMVPHTTFDIVQGSLRLEGINPASISGYSSSKYENADGEKSQALFQPSDLISVQTAPASASLLKDKWFLTYDEYGFPVSIFTSKENPIFNNAEIFGNNFNLATGAIIFLKLEYCPKNKYDIICQKFYSLIEAEQVRIFKYETEIGDEKTENSLKYQIKVNTEQRESLIQQKELLNFKLERVLGPALREGYWQPDDYNDPGEGHDNTISFKERQNDQDVYFIFDEVLFEEEGKEYYYQTELDIIQDNKTYYPYIDLTNIYFQIASQDKKISDFSLNLLNPRYTWEITSNGSLQANGKYYFLLDGKYYYFQLGEKIYSKGDILVLNTKDGYVGETYVRAPYITIEGTQDYYEMENSEPLESVPLDQMNGNLTNAFMGLNQYLSTRHLFNNAGFTISFLKTDKEIKMVALLQDINIDYERYKTVLCSFNRNESVQDFNLSIQSNSETKYPIVYPRLYLKNKNVNKDSDNFKVSIPSIQINLTKYEDYSILNREGYTYVTLKATDINKPSYILDQPYNIIYQVSRANDMLYLDAKQVAKDSSKPKYSYEVSISNLPEEINQIQLGQLVYINDYTIDARKEYGYVSGIMLNLSSPSKDSITIANYKTKFEDLFASITAQNESMKQNQAAYNIAAASFTSFGEIESSILQTTLNNNDFAFNFSNSNVSLDNTGGLVLTNVEPYSNGVYGQVALKGGGLFCSNSTKEDGTRLWNTAVTPDGINASVITAGRLDTNLIRIYSGTTLAFQWNSTGLYAFRELIEDNNEPKLDASSYVRLNEEGLLYSNNGEAQLELGWNGLSLYGANGRLKLTTENGLQLFSENNIPLVTFGRNEEEKYGVFFLDADGNTTLKATQDGNLVLTGQLIIGDIKEGAKAWAVLDGGNVGSTEYTEYLFYVGTTVGDTDYQPTYEEFNNYPIFAISGNGSILAKQIVTWGSDTEYSTSINYANSQVLQDIADSDTFASTIQATAIIADDFLYTSELQADSAIIETAYVDNLILKGGDTITFTKGDKKAIVSFDGEKINVVYE